MEPKTSFVRILSAGLLAIFLSLAFAPAIPMASFLSQQSYIVETFCINKEQPEMKCNGNCYLMRQLKEASMDTESKALPIKQRVSGFIPLFLESNQISLPQPAVVHIDQGRHLVPDLNMFANSLFRPPRQV